MMEALGFPGEFWNRIAEGITTVTYSVLINGASTGFFQPQRGLQQGDPKSPFLFLICVEGFSTLLWKRGEQGVLHGMLVVPRGMSLSHLFFADDAIIFCRAEEEEVREVMDVLQCYAEASGQVINREKSSLYFGAQCLGNLRKALTICTNITGKEEFGKYLGIKANFGSSKKAVFEGVREALEERINGWAKQFLFPEGSAN